MSRANVEATKAFIRARLGNPYVYGGALSPTAVRQGTDCSEVVQTVAEMMLGRYVPGRQSEGATTESYRPVGVGQRGPFGTIRVGGPGDIPSNAALKVALHHGPGGGANSHMWCELDGMRVESRGGVGLITQPRAMAINDRYGNAWCYLPGPIVEDGTPVAPVVVVLGRNYESYGERVRQLQAALNAYGHGLDTDGDYGPLTEAAVGAFQRSKGIEVDGIAGPSTLAALGLNFGGSATPSAVDKLELFRQMMSRTEASNQWLEVCLPHYVEAMRAADINTVNRAAAFASQLGHESSGLRYMAEIQTNGPGWTEDRRVYRGRGAIQLTWSGNYRRFGEWCHQEGRVTDPEIFVKAPALVERPEWGFLAASWYWRFGGPKPGRINEFADAGDILAVSRCVNGWIEGVDPVGWADRRSRYLNCMTMGGKLLALSVASPDLLEELLTMKIQSQSIYATPGHGPIDASVMLAALDAHGPHEPYVEAQARKGDQDALFRLARTAAGKGTVKTPGAIKQATDVLLEIGATNPDLINTALGRL